MTFLVSTSHNLTFQSLLPLAIVFPFGDNAMDRNPTLFSCRQSSPICAPLSRSHSRSEPSDEHVMMCRLPDILRARSLDYAKSWPVCTRSLPGSWNQTSYTATEMIAGCVLTGFDIQSSPTRQLLDDVFRCC
ncbi:hypothetical protein BDR03DRAFT_947286 [Suillus americanus]|nr:hypothetical protein BDR03DRAFT_947286 [Suillus americanus]